VSLARIPAVRATALLRRSLGVAASALVVAAVIAPAALAQQTPYPTETPTQNTGGWVYGMAVLVGAIGIVIVLLIIFAYLRVAPRFARGDGAARTVRAPVKREGEDFPRRAVDVRQAASVVVPPPAVAAAVAAPATAPASPALVSPGPATAPPPAVASAPPAPAAAPAPAAPATPAADTQPAPSAPAERPEVSMDQETFDAKLEELLAKGTDRRVAEGQARRAAMIAARKKAGG